MDENATLDLEKTYATILAAARERRYVNYGTIAKANGVSWRSARPLVFRQLDRLVAIAHERGWPQLSAIVVSERNLRDGRLDGKSLEGFVGAVRKAGVRVVDPAAYVREQQEQVFAWATSAPDVLQTSTWELNAESRGPAYVRYFGELLDALRALEGEATPDAVYQWIAENQQISTEELSRTTKTGRSLYKNRIRWARQYLTQAGLVNGRRRGIWSLTASGRETYLTYQDALMLYREIDSQSKFSNSEDEPASERATTDTLFDDPERRFWFVGAVWRGNKDQLHRFLEEGIWQNNHDEKFADHVQRIRPGDRIAVKAAFVQKYNLPFDNRGKPVSCMRIKAIGTVTASATDGKTIKVNWERLDPARDWFFYTYRVTVVEADPEDDLARRLILFAFGGVRQDYEFWTQEIPYFARRYGPAAISSNQDVSETSGNDTDDHIVPYRVDDIVKAGSFIAKQAVEQILRRAQMKKNLILQGPPGTGKSWLAKKLSYALIGSKERTQIRNRLRVVQFHPSLSYEDFVRGWRPTAGSTLELVDGIFLQTVQAATAEPDRPFVLIIEEINRGNPAQIFGEMLTLLENSKRTADEAIELAYRRREGERVFIPSNLHVIGTMNIADRSLALVDLALRRRFAFVDLEPVLNSTWQEWCERCGLDQYIVEHVRDRIHDLNKDLSEDPSLGPQYRIGHSYVTPLLGTSIHDGRQWFREVVETEITPLLEEYWFDSLEKVKSARRKLLDGLQRDRESE